jgi:NIPSNAP
MSRYGIACLVLLPLAFCKAIADNQTTMDTRVSHKIVEILTLDVKPGRRGEFHKVYENQSLPLLKKWKIDVIAYGPSLHDANSYYIIRSFRSLKERQKLEGAFYRSNDWKNGPKDTILSLVDHFAYIVLPAGRLQEIASEL